MLATARARDADQPVTKTDENAEAVATYTARAREEESAFPGCGASPTSRIGAVFDPTPVTDQRVIWKGRNRGITPG
jgi:hypothetical protein